MAIDYNQLQQPLTTRTTAKKFNSIKNTAQNFNLLSSCKQRTNKNTEAIIIIIIVTSSKASPTSLWNFFCLKVGEN